VGLRHPVSSGPAGQGCPTNNQGDNSPTSAEVTYRDQGDAHDRGGRFG
jgi:hypothetical protein